MAHYEVVAGPWTLYIAPVGTAFPALDEEPGVGWTKVGTNGARNYTEDGVTINHEQSVEEWRSLASTGPVKAFRTEEGQTISCVVADMTLEQYSVSLNGNAVASQAAGVGNPGYKKIGLWLGPDVEEYALFVRGQKASPYGAAWPAQYEVPRVCQVGEAEIVYVKGEPAGRQLEFKALEDPDAATDDERMGVLRVQTAVAL